MPKKDRGKLDLTRRKVLSGLTTIGAVSAVAGMGTMAEFTDVEDLTNEDNPGRVKSGQIDLVASGSPVPDDFTLKGMEPGETRAKTYTLKNDPPNQLDSAIDIEALCYNIDIMDDLEDGVPEPETDKDSGNGGELDKFLVVEGRLNPVGGGPEYRWFKGNIRDIQNQGWKCRRIDPHLRPGDNEYEFTLRFTFQNHPQNNQAMLDQLNLKIQVKGETDASS
ncbi:hypothetical protein [Haloferax sulfurifontis]|uniref:Uncharacterized protein n=2 Tax=Haloferax sulfurifontis TaxID=255616 RepID=M0IQZ7_9EURY|nr:hypothetical protein [Haloferax sulfurifontis]ELZ98452.1 hypothetical protein C441_01199 [Haloferax sulfurifontis ATCC BAA-897]GGC60011.1 hypothetical protein GCM10007209_22630 [Haloferax sulfurifontis]